MKWKRFSRKRNRGQWITRLMARDGENCSICDKKLDRKLKDYNSDWYITFDHIVPSSLGGLTVLSNLRLAHQVCNFERGNSPVLDEEDIT